MNGPEPRFRNPCSYGLRMEKREVALLRVMASRRDLSVAQLLREAIRPLIQEAEKRYGKTIPGEPTALSRKAGV